MPLSSKYLNLSLMKPFCSSKLKYLIMSSSDVKGTETVEVLLAILNCLIPRFKMKLRCSDRKSWNIRHFFVPRLGLGIKKFKFETDTCCLSIYWLF